MLQERISSAGFNYKTFMAVIVLISYETQRWSPSVTLNLIMVGAYPSGTPYGTPFFEQKANIKIGVEVTNTLAYYHIKCVMAIQRSFMMQTLCKNLSRGLFYKTFYGRNLLIFVIRQSVCLWQAFPPQSNICGRNFQKDLQ